MSTSYQFVWDGSSIQIEFDVEVVGFGQVLTIFNDALAALHAAIPLRSLSLKRAGDHYNYAFTSVDGRQYHNKIKVPLGDPKYIENTMLTFNVPHFFKRSELEPHRALREELIRLIVNKSLSSVTVGM